MYLDYTYTAPNGATKPASALLHDLRKRRGRRAGDAGRCDPRQPFHNGGRIASGRTKARIATGAADVDAAAQDLSSLAGKILRINPDGSIPADTLRGLAGRQPGHRNPQGLALAPGDRAPCC